MNKKVLTIVAVLAITACLATSGVMSMFTAKTDSDFKAQAGTVEIEVTSPTMTNSNNINPGDNDPSTPSSVTTTDHEFSFDVANTGTKSARTRQTIVLTVKEDGTGAKFLDARFLALYLENKEVSGKVYVLEDGTEVTSIPDAKFVKAIKYTFISDSFDGKGKDIKNGGNAEKESSGTVTASGEEKVVKAYKYDFAMLKEAGNIYQGSNISLEVLVEAMQYRNTKDSDWSTATKVNKTFTASGVTTTVVPASDQDKDGNTIK